MCKLCVFAGTSEGRRLVERLSGRGAAITACVATAYGGDMLEGLANVRVLAGRMDAAEMAALLDAERFDAVVDATHPYADRATGNIAAACERAGVEYLRVERPSGADAADGVFVADVDACAEYLRGTEGAILLTTGSKELPAFCADEGLRERLYVRVLPVTESLRLCAECGIPPERIVAMQGPFGEEMNVATLRSFNAKYLVTKDTGGAGGYAAKITAARKAGAKAVVIGRPPQREGRSVEDVAAALEVRFSLAPAPKQVTLVGIGMGDADTRTLGAARALRQADCVIGAKRLLESVGHTGKRLHSAIRAEEIVDIIRKDTDSRRFAVLLSGDTGFYSGAKRLLAALDGMDVEVLPGISSLQYLCAKLGRPWEDVRAVSLHGRDCDIAREARLNPAVFILLGGENDAKTVLDRLARAGLGHLSAAVGERLGYPDETITRGTVEALARGEYDALSVLLAENPNAGEAVVTPGIPDEAFERGDIPMTKSEVRAVSLSKLRLTRRAVVYDIGSGSGSVSVEAALLAREGHVYAVEMKPEAAALTRRNAERFHLENVAVVEGRAPGALAGLPAPTHAFIGGSAGDMEAVVDCLLEMNPRVRIVANAVTLESVAALSALSKGFDHCDVAEVSVAKPRALGRYRLMTAQNPVVVFAMWNGEGDTHQ